MLALRILEAVMSDSCKTKYPKFIIKIGAKVADIWFKLLGDKNPDTYKVINQFTTVEFNKFNEVNKDSVDLNALEQAIADDVAPRQLISGKVNIINMIFDNIEYRAYDLGNDVINIGTYFIVD